MFIKLITGIIIETNSIKSMDNGLDTGDHFITLDEIDTITDIYPS